RRPGDFRNFRGSRNNQTIPAWRTPNNYGNPRKPHLSTEEIIKIENDQRQRISENFSSSELTYGGSDKIIQVPLGREFNKKKRDKVEGLVYHLGSPNGMSRIREILMFEMSVDAGLKPNVASFQRVILPFLALLTRKAISDCTLERYLNAIYSIVYNNLEPFIYDGVINMLQILVRRNNIDDQEIIIVGLINELLKRFKSASIDETMINISEKLENLKNEWKNKLTSAALSSDPLAMNEEQRKYFFIVLDREIDRMNGMLHKPKHNLSETAKTLSKVFTSVKEYWKKTARNVDLKRSYDPPGELSVHGPRHSNDFTEISKISIIPTTDEILCKREPYLPVASGNDDLHHLPKGAARLLDRQFRLLREDMLNAFRTSINSFLTLIGEPNENRAKIENYKKSGGRYRSKSDGGDLNVYSNIHFTEVIANSRNGFFFRVAFTPPSTKMPTRTVKERKDYWRKTKKLGNGNLVCLLWPNEDVNNYVGNSNSTIASKYSIYFGIIADRDEYFLTKDRENAEIGINFIDTSLHPIAIKDISFRHKNNREIGYRFLVESTDLLFESFKNILKTLQETDPSDLPFEEYFAPPFESKSNVPTSVNPPIYTLAPNFRFNLAILLRPESRDQSIYLNVSDSQSHNDVTKTLLKHSTFDETQAKALVSSLCREVALIEGPPGTGKSYVGVGIMRALLAPENQEATKIGPILTICYTNHALGNFLEGSRSKSEIISEFNLDEICRNRRSQTKWLIKQTFQDLDEIIEEASTINKQLTNRTLDIGQASVDHYLVENYPTHYIHLKNPDIPSFLLDHINNGDEFRKVKKKGKTNRSSIIEQWVNGDDLTAAQKFKESLMNPYREQEEEGKWNENPFILLPNDDDMFTEAVNLNDYIGYTEIINENDYIGEMDTDTVNVNDYIGEMNTENTVKSIIDFSDDNGDNDTVNNAIMDRDWNVWGMSKEERVRLHDFWREKINSETIEDLSKDLSDIQERYLNKKKDLEDIYNEGEVLEAHVLASLTKSAQHLILIGDHNQLRPKIRKDYRFDVSLFERLIHGEQSMRLERTQLLTQRRMRKEIADLIRQTIYPDLEDHPLTKDYPKVRGIQHNVYFMHHVNCEDPARNEFALQSRSNNFEVEMVVEMPEQIAVLTPYLGQMIKIKEALSESFAVVIDERDAEQLANWEEKFKDDDTDEMSNTISIASRKKLNRQVSLRTIDNFQGEEADVVIISLVRNITEHRRNTIGFLKTVNRTNVLLSRAKHGMYLMGNAELMENESDMWKKVIDILRSRNQVGTGFPIICDQHPENKNIITYPRKFEEVSPDGGCLLPCGKALDCGHICPHKCHPDDPKPCNRLLKGCSHPCTRKCGENCGECLFPIGDLLLPCGHVLIDAICYQKNILDKIKCRTMVDKMLPNCEHTVTVECYKSVDNLSCQSICGLLNPECDHVCKSLCSDCQRKSIHANDYISILDNNGHIVRTHHEKCKQICEKNLFCGHLCEEFCHLNKDCPGCKKKCNVNCKHSVCDKPCSYPCSVCAEECDWYCEHKGICGVSCGVPCNRLPCNEQCSKLLKCGHQCMGICGEECPPPKYCIICAPDDIKNSIVDLIMQTTFSEVDWTTERMIVLECGHVFTAETLDNLMEMKSVYHMDFMENWIDIKEITDQPGELKRCPNCRAPIKNIQRYGRIIKKCVLDVQNRKFLREYNRRLKVIQVELEEIIKNLEKNREKVLEKLKKSDLPDLKQRNNNDDDFYEIDKKIKRIVPDIVPPEECEILTKYSIPPYHEELWRKHVSPLLFNYRQVSLIISNSTNPPYKLAYEAAVASLFAAKSKERFYMDDLINDFSLLQISNDSPAVLKNKFQETLKEVGISVPKVDRKIYLAAFFELINIQKAMFHEVSKIIPELPTEMKQHNVSIHLPYKDYWMDFANVLINSLRKHIEHIIQISNESKYNLGLSPIQQREIKNKCSDIKMNCLVIKLGILPSMNGVYYFKEQCNERIETVLREIKEIKNATDNAGRLSYEEKLKIHQAMRQEFLGSGHWYQCPNGHPYTIGDCGGADQISRCPECGAFIGGSNHQTLSGNELNVEFERMG
ncbi:199_t:CDS:10, partial [Diversispora eburnea]